jgi:uncharacterized protein YjbI with pentapeptide repeats
MDTCSYTWEDFDNEKGEFIEKRCTEETWEGSDKFCIFHDPSPEKDVGLFKAKLEEQIESETQRLDFSGYHFPENWSFSSQNFRIDVNFWGATFQKNVYFDRTVFQGHADFSRAKFEGEVRFCETDFRKYVNFERAYFKDGAAFDRSIFQDRVDFIENNFKGGLSFDRTVFQDHVDFRETDFHGYTHFSGASFQNVDFEGATFKDVEFIGATFKDVEFRRAIFRNAYFDETVFRDADFIGASFNLASFNRAIFQAYADFSMTKFKGDASFVETTFQDVSFEKATIERNFSFISPQVEKFDLQDTQFFFRGSITANLAQAKFHRAYIENISFTGCDWPRGSVIYEEVHMEDENLSFKEMETIYRSLKQNMERHGDYSRAGEFYYREMEMRRKGTKKKKERLLLELYRFLAGYGEFYWNTAAFSGIIILIFALLYGISDCLQYSVRNPCIYQEIIDVVYFSFVTFTTLGLGDIRPLTSLGKVLVCFEAVIGAFMIAVFVVVFVRKMAR